MSRGLLLFAHGARDPAWAEPFRAVAERAGGAAPGVAVELAFLEFMTPDFAAAARRLVERGATRIDVVPLFLGTGGHLRKDLPPMIEAAVAAHPGTTIRLHAAIGETPAVIDAMADAAASIARFGE